MVRTLQFAPYTLFTLERTYKYTQPCDIYRLGQTQFHYSPTLEWLLVGSDGGRVVQLFLVGKEICSDDFHVILLFFLNLVQGWSSPNSYVYTPWLTSRFLRDRFFACAAERISMKWAIAYQSW